MARNKPERTLGYPKWETFTKKMDEVLNAEHPIGYAIIWTDAQLRDAVNEKLDEQDQISERTFRNYKSGEIGDDDIMRVFVACYKKALRLQLDNLFFNFAEADPGSWQKWAWLAERKFDEWNLKSRFVDETPEVKRLVFRVIGD